MPHSTKISQPNQYSTPSIERALSVPPSLSTEEMLKRQHFKISKSNQYSTLSIQKTFEALQVDPSLGLSAEEVQKRQLSGLNILHLEQKESLIYKFIAQFQNPLILLLLASALISVFIGHVEDAVSIAITIVIVLSVAFVQEYQSEQSLEALNKLAPHHCHVIRFSKRNSGIFILIQKRIRSGRTSK